MEYKYKYLLTKELFRYNKNEIVEELIELEQDTYEETFSSYKLVEVEKKYYELIEKYGKVDKGDKMTCCLRIHEITISKEYGYEALRVLYNEVLLKDDAY